MARRSVPSKWKKTAVMLRSKQIRRYIPKTLLYRPSALDSLIRRYGMVYVKPDTGSQGVGVMRVQQNARKGPPSFSVQRGSKITRRLTWYGLVSELKPYVRKRTHVVQRGIDLLRFNGRLLDIRAVTMLDPQRKWRFIGMLARIAQPSKAVTNGSQGADITTCQYVIVRNGRTMRTYQRLEEQIRDICLKSAHILHKKYPGFQELGFDIALDQKLHPWILEVNTSPASKPFGKLADKSMYYRIHAYRRFYK